MSHNTLDKATLRDLPATVKITLPPKDSVHIAIAVIGYIILAIGFGFIIFGPNEIYYDAVTGMTFTQMLQAYPGPIATGGGLIVALSSHLSKSAEQEHMDNKLLAVEKAIQIENSDIPEGHQLSVTWLNDDTFQLELEEKTVDAELEGAMS